MSPPQFTIWEVLHARDSAALSALIASGTDANALGAVSDSSAKCFLRTVFTQLLSLPDARQGEQTPLHLASELDAKACVSVLLAANAVIRSDAAG